MLLNPQKHIPTSFKVIINDHGIYPKDYLKNISWKPHVQKVKTQQSRACGVLSKFKHYSTQSVFKVITL